MGKSTDFTESANEFLDEARQFAAKAINQARGVPGQLARRKLKALTDKAAQDTDLDEILLSQLDDDDPAKALETAKELIVALCQDKLLLEKANEELAVRFAKLSVASDSLAKVAGVKEVAVPASTDAELQKAAAKARENFADAAQTVTDAAQNFTAATAKAVEEALASLQSLLTKSADDEDEDFNPYAGLMGD